MFNDTNRKQVNIAYLLTCLSFVGFSGVQRFYLGKPLSGVIWFFTGGLFFLGTIYDLITLPHQVRQANLMIGYDNNVVDPSIIEANYTVVRDVEKPANVKTLSLEAQIIDLAENAELNQITLKDVIKAGISLENGKAILENFANEGVCDEVSMDGIKRYCF